MAVGCTHTNSLVSPLMCARRGQWPPRPWTPGPAIVLTDARRGAGHVVSGSCGRAAK